MWRLKAALEIQHHPCLPALAFALVPPSTIAVAHVLRRWFRCSTSSIHHVGFNDKIKNAKQIPNISEGTEPAGSDKSSASLNPWSKCMCHHVPPTGKWQGKHVKSCNDLCVWRCSLRAFQDILKRFEWMKTHFQTGKVFIHFVLAHAVGTVTVAGLPNKWLPWNPSRLGCPEPPQTSTSPGA